MVCAAIFTITFTIVDEFSFRIQRFGYLLTIESLLIVVEIIVKTSPGIFTKFIPVAYGSSQCPAIARPIISSIAIRVYRTLL